MGIEIFAIDANGNRLAEIHETKLDWVWKPGTEEIKKAFNELYIHLFDKYVDLDEVEDQLNFHFFFEPEFYLKIGALDYTDSKKAFCVALGIKFFTDKISISPSELKRLIKKAKWYNSNMVDFSPYNIEAAKGFAKICKKYNLGIMFW